MTAFKLIIGNKNYSSWSLRGWLALKVSGLAFEEVRLPLDTPEFADRIKTLSPSGTVPALWHDGETIWDSLAIIDYIATLYPEKSIWPSAPKAFGYAKAISCEMHSGLFALRAAMPMNMREQFTDLSVSATVQKNIDRVEAMWTKALNIYAGDGPYLFGDQFGGADMMFAPVVSRFRTYNIQLNEPCERYRKAVEAHPAYQDWHRVALTETEIVDQDEVDRDIKILGSD